MTLARARPPSCSALPTRPLFAVPATKRSCFFAALCVGSTSPNYLFLILVNLLGLVFLVLPLILAGFLLRLLAKPIISYFWMLPL